MKRFTTLFALFFLFDLVIPRLAASQPSYLDSLKTYGIVDLKLRVPMRDGVRLATDVFRPKTDDPVPIIFSRTPYNFNWYRDGELSQRAFRSAWEAVKRGYAYIVQNERGQFFSEGEWDILGTPRTDGYDAFTWMADQPWSNGRVGTIGCSSTAEWQMAVAAMDHPAHAAMIAQGYGAGVGRIGEFVEQGNWYRGGAEQMLFFAWLYGVQNDQRPMFPKDISREDLIRLSKYFDLAPEMPSVDWSEALWHLPLTDIMKNVDGPEGIYEDMIKRKPNDPAWYEGGLYHDNMRLGAPSMWFVSWYDVSSGPNLALFNHVLESAEDPEVRNNQFMVIAPTTHCGYTRVSEETIVGERNVGDPRLDYDELTYGWFDYWLKGEENGILDTLPRVRYYTMGSNEWQTADAWPPENARMETYYLTSGGHANTRVGDGRLTRTPPGADEPVDSFEYDPMNPVMSYGGNVCCTGNAIQGGAFDQQEQELNPNILVYTSEPLAEGIEVTGSIEVTLYVSTDVRDTDFTVKLLDVYPDGTAYNLDETILRARYREGFDREVFMEEGEVYELKMSPLSTSNFYDAGHRIRIEVSSSNFPRFTRNMNTGGSNYDETEGIVAHSSIHHTRVHASQIRLPIIRD